MKGGKRGLCGPERASRINVDFFNSYKPYVMMHFKNYLWSTV